MGAKRRRYLTIFEDGLMETWEEVPEEIFPAADDGLYTVIDMDTGLQWFDGEWIEIEPGTVLEA